MWEDSTVYVDRPCAGESEGGDERAEDEGGEDEPAELDEEPVVEPLGCVDLTSEVFGLIHLHSTFSFRLSEIQRTVRSNICAPSIPTGISMCFWLKAGGTMHWGAGVGVGVYVYVPFFTQPVLTL